MTRLIQLHHPDRGRSVARVEGDEALLLTDHDSVMAVALTSLREGVALARLVEHLVGSERLDYDAIYQGRSPWRLMPAADHPEEPTRCLVTGTGLTHRASAANRQAMHEAQESGAVTDSMRMYQLGVEGGRPDANEIGVAPEWFFKGNGRNLRGHGDALEIPAFAEDGGEEPEIAGVYLIDDQEQPRRIGMAIGNEFSDHALERRNYLYLAPSKLRTASIGPELVIGADFGDVKGAVTIRRGAQTVWTQAIETGEANMCHSLANLEHHHFKHPEHRVPGDLHVHFFGAAAFSFGAGLKLEAGDVMEIAWTGFGRPLRNALRVSEGPQPLITAKPV